MAERVPLYKRSPPPGGSPSQSTLPPFQFWTVHLPTRRYRTLHTTCLMDAAAAHQRCAPNISNSCSRGYRGKRIHSKARGNHGVGDLWRLLRRLEIAVWETGTVPQQLGWNIIVMIPKDGGDYHQIGLLEPIWKITERVMDWRLNDVELRSSLHGCWNGCGTRTAIIKAKLAQQLAHLEQKPFFGVFLDLKKAFDAMDRDSCLLVLEGYGVGPNMRRLIRHFWDKVQMVCHASSNYGMSFKASRGLTQGSPLSTMSEVVTVRKDNISRLVAEYLVGGYMR
jgi:hypothetical protein